MSENTKIEWCDYTFNPWIGCTKVSPGCANCYAESQDKFRSWTPDGWGKGKPRKRTSEANWKKPMQWARKAEKFMECSLCGWRGDPYIENFGCCGNPECNGLPSELDRARPRVFCASLADVFDSDVSYDWRYDLFELIEATPELDWLLLTKRPENIRKQIAEIALPICEAWDCENVAPDNVWLGTSVEDQKRADERVPLLCEIPAAVRFLSAEPLLEPISFLSAQKRCNGKIDWVIAGGESGSGAREFKEGWAGGLRDQCELSGAAFFMKQFGSNGRLEVGDCYVDAGFRNAKGGDPEEWPAPLRVREFPTIEPC